MAADLRALGIQQPQQLAAQDALSLYQALCRHSGKRQDPCVLDTFLAATDFMRGAAPAPWWAYTAERKRLYRDI
ncbi:MAG: mitomycin resistance protein [Burkholderiaceae bacterium]|nr:mitomycin resistance protein [Burkholderiaceae bacterium]